MNICRFTKMIFHGETRNNLPNRVARIARKLAPARRHRAAAKGSGEGDQQPGYGYTVGQSRYVGQPYAQVSPWPLQVPLQETSQVPL